MTVSTLRSYPSVVRDGLQEAPGRGGHVQKLIKGANALMATLDRLEKLMLSLQGGRMKWTPFSDSPALRVDSLREAGEDRCTSTPTTTCARLRRDTATTTAHQHTRAVGLDATMDRSKVVQQMGATSRNRYDPATHGSSAAARR
jgi:hypothetical protein